VANLAAVREQEARIAPPARSRLSWSWLGLVPFFLFCTAFLFLPVAFLVIGSFYDQEGNLSLQNYADLSTGIIPGAFANSIEISLITAVAGGIFGFLLAASVILGGLPRVLRGALLTFSGVASNFAGIPLALAFIFTLGTLGFLTVFLQSIGLTGFRGVNLTSKLGVEIVYMYFQFPLMVLIIAPALEGLRREWREAAENMGASAFQYWRHVALPILTPSILGTMILLFGNSFGAQATAFQLTGGTLPLVTLVISSQIRGDVLHNPGLGYAMAMGMVVIMGMSIFLYTLLQRRAERWLRT
jgi:putative spermidine/putrescine transport system permease protein